MPKVSDNNASTTRRRSARPPAKSKKLTVTESAPAEDASDDALRMPAGYNPSDDSEDEYVPPEKKKKSILTKSKRSRKESVGSDSDDEDSAATPAKRARSKKPEAGTPSQRKAGTPGQRKAEAPSQNRKTKQTTLLETLPKTTVPSNATRLPTVPTVLKEQKEPKQLIFNNKCSCPFEGCKERLTADGNAKFHLALHYYDDNKYSTEDILIPQDADASGKAIDEKGKAIKYSCQVPNCTKRKMGYKEMCVHIATQHGKLQILMAKDPSQDVRDLYQALFPPPVDVKREEIAEDAPEGVDQAEPTNNSEDEDDPDDPAPAPAKATPSRRGPKSKTKTMANVESNTKNVRMTPSTTSAAAAKKSNRPKVDKIMNCILCDEKEGKNLNAGTSELKYHLSVCVYSMGGFLDILPAHQGTMDIKKIEEFGNRFKYKCPFENCDKSSGKSKAIGYKEFAIHAGVMHGILERWAAQNTDRKGAEELYQLLKNMREDEGIPLPEVPDIPYEELHVCFICDGEDKEGKNLSFSAEKVYQTRYHYAACIYDTGLYVELYPPGKQNMSSDGKPRDILGREVKYSCQEKGCSLKRKMGYKEFVIHMANDHGGLEKVLENHSDERVREISKKLKTKKR